STAMQQTDDLIQILQFLGISVDCEFIQFRKFQKVFTDAVVREVEGDDMHLLRQLFGCIGKHAPILEALKAVANDQDGLCVVRTCEKIAANKPVWSHLDLKR